MVVKTVVKDWTDTSIHFPLGTEITLCKTRSSSSIMPQVPHGNRKRIMTCLNYSVEIREEKENGVTVHVYPYTGPIRFISSTDVY